ncbi:MAG: hypothetical protein HC902_15095 [Calothrix sp. SM1_5_4]|nr:hypothetical protein [Calothrix sp. SM1_5_4]
MAGGRDGVGDDLGLDHWVISLRGYGLKSPVLRLVGFFPEFTNGDLATPFFELSTSFASTFTHGRFDKVWAVSQDSTGDQV